MMGPGKPSDTQSNFQSRTNFLTTRTIRRGVMVGPDGYLRGSFCPVASTLTFVPPRSITRTACAVTGCLFMMDSLPRTIRRYHCCPGKNSQPQLKLLISHILGTVRAGNDLN